MFVIYLHTKFKMSRSNGSVGIAIQPKHKCIFYEDARLFFDILQIFRKYITS
jgi:hypothetical protein